MSTGARAPAATSDRRRSSAPFPHLANAAASGVLRRPTLADVAKLLRDGHAQHVVVLCGAGISTGAGIPDFRSPGTGLYDNLARYHLPYPEAIFDIDYLKERPQAFYTLAKELYPGNFKPTTTHYFFKLLQEKGLLTAVWTQNIDTLERIAGIDEDHIVEAHGSFASAACLECGQAYTKESIRPEIMLGRVVRCTRRLDRQQRRRRRRRSSPARRRTEPSSTSSSEWDDDDDEEEGEERETCRGLVKPDIVFFGEGLPDKFFARLAAGEFAEPRRCDLLLVLGTSLSVGPFNSLVGEVGPSCPRVLINLERVGEAADAEDEDSGGFFQFDDREGDEDGGEGGEGTTIPRDVFWQGEADAGVEELCRLVGDDWATELAHLRTTGWAQLDRAATAAAAGGEENGTDDPERSAASADDDDLSNAVKQVKLDDDDDEPDRNEP